MQHWFSLEEVAFLLQTSPKTIHRLLESKELKGVKRGFSWSISKVSLRKWVFGAIRKACTPRNYNKKKNDGIKTEQFDGQSFALNRYIYARKPHILAKLMKPR